MSGEPSGSEGFAWIRMLWTLNNNNTVDERLQTAHALPWLPGEAKTSGRPYLDAWRDVINDPDGFAVRMAR